MGEILESVEPGDNPSPNDPLAGLTAVPISAPRGIDVIFLSEEWGFILGVQELIAYDIDTGKPLYRRAGTGGSVEVSHDRDLIAYSEGGSVTLLDTTTWEEVVQIPVDNRVRGLGFNADNSRLAIGELDTLRVVDTATGQAVQELALANISDVLWIDDETLLVATGEGIVGTVSLSTDDFLATVRAGLRRSFTQQECELYGIDPCPTLEELRGR